MKHAKMTLAVRAGVWLAMLVTAIEADAVVPPSEQLLPASTVAYIRVANPADLEAQWRETQLGQFAQDPSLQPFVEHLRDSIPRRLGNLQDRLGITADDVQGVAGGELAWAIIGRQEGRAASVLLVDTTGNAEKRDALLTKIDNYLMERKATKSSEMMEGISVTSYDIPPGADDEQARTAAYFIHDDLLCVADHRTVVAELATRVTGGGGDSLASVAAYTAVMEKCTESGAVMQDDIRWFVDPFPLVDALRTIRPRTSDGEDRIQQLRNQGFDAVRGIGGLVSVAPDDKHDFIHCSAIFAPPAPGAPEGKRYRLGMNVFRTPNAGVMELHNWTPRMIARYTTVSIDLLNAFDNVDTLFDEIVAGYEGAFETAMDRFKDDPFGPQIDFRKDIVANLGTRVSAMTDYTLPIDTNSERFLVAIEVKEGQMPPLRVAIGKYLEKDNYVKREIENREVWEFLPEEEENFDIGLNDGGLFPEESIADEDRDDRLLTRSAVCVSDGHLFIASDIEFLRLAFQQAAQNESLAESFDYLAVAESLAKLAPNQQCSWTFTRTDEVIRPTYVLLRQGRLPQGESFFARLLNELLTTPDDQKNQLLRKQRIDGSELPAYELARRYFGPSGRTVRSDEDGWLITGVLLNKAEN